MRVKVGVRSGLGSVSVRVTCTVRAMVRARTRVGPGMVRGRVGRFAPRLAAWIHTSLKLNPDPDPNPDPDLTPTPNLIPIASLTPTVILLRTGRLFGAGQSQLPRDCPWPKCS